MNYSKLYAKRVPSLIDKTVVNALKYASDPNIISLSGGIPNHNLFPISETQQIINKIIQNKSSLQQTLQYSTVQGILELRQQIAIYYSKLWNMDITPEHILITSGSQQAIDLLGKAFLNESQDNIIIENPTYLVAITAFNTYQPKYLTLNFNRHNQPDLKQLEEYLKNKQVKFIYTIPTFQNPTGKTWNTKTRKQVSDLLDKYKILLVEDDPYSSLYFQGKPPLAVSQFNQLQNSIYLGTFSKTLMPGLRIGFIIAKPKLIESFTLIKQSMDLHSSVLSQKIISQLLNIPNFYQNHLNKIRTYYADNAYYLNELLKTHLNKYITWNKPKGGLFIWGTTKHINIKQLMVNAISNKVAFMPGYPFFVNNINNKTFRITFATATKKQMDTAVKLLAKSF